MKVRYRLTERKGQLTIVACASAAGQVLPPTILFDSKKCGTLGQNNELSGTIYGCSEKGWITTEFFQSWLSNRFLEHAESVHHFFHDLVEVGRTQLTYCTTENMVVDMFTKEVSIKQFGKLCLADITEFND